MLLDEGVSYTSGLTGTKEGRQRFLEIQRDTLRLVSQQASAMLYRTRNYFLALETLKPERTFSAVEVAGILMEKCQECRSVIDSEISTYSPPEEKK